MTPEDIRRISNSSDAKWRQQEVDRRDRVARFNRDFRSEPGMTRGERITLAACYAMLALTVLAWVAA